MSQVLWCDRGDHAFPASQPGSQSGNVSEVGDDGVAIQKRIDICAEHTDKGQYRKALEAENTRDSIYGTPSKSGPMSARNIVTDNREGY